MWASISQEALRKSVPFERFDGIRAIQAHLDLRNQVEDYVAGNSVARPVVPDAGCAADCTVEKWLHGMAGRHCTEIPLVDALRQSCREFHQAAAQALMLADLGKRDAACFILRSKSYCEASEAYQTCLAKLHLACAMEE